MCLATDKSYKHPLCHQIHTIGPTHYHLFLLPATRALALSYSFLSYSMDSNSLTTPSHNAEDLFQYALSSNGAWAGYKAHQNPQFFSKLASGQSPQIRTLPCSWLSCLTLPLSYRQASHVELRCHVHKRARPQDKSPMMARNP